MSHEPTQDRDDAGRFSPGNSTGAAGGRPRGMGPARTLEALIRSDGPELFQRAFERAKVDDNVLAAVMHLIASVETSSSVAAFRLAAAPTESGARN